MINVNFIEEKIMNLIEKQKQSYGIERYMYLSKIFDFIGTHIITIKKKYPLLYSTSIQRQICFKMKIMENLNDKNVSEEEIKIYQNCLTILHGFETSLNL